MDLDIGARGTGAPRRVAFYGGTFDPPHRGHLEVARAAADRFGLDLVLLAPAAVQPLKAQPPVASYAARLEMTELLCLEDGRLRASELDRPKRSGEPNYTVDSLLRLKSELPPETQLYAIAGADAFLDLHRWKDPTRLLQLAEWIVISRPGFNLEDFPVLESAAEGQTHVHLVDDIAIPASASRIRRELGMGGDCNQWLVPAISDYIRQHHLYS